MKANCPLCHKPADEKHKPFCSKRCADIDLGRWLGGRYRVETDEKINHTSKPSDDNDDVE